MKVMLKIAIFMTVFSLSMFASTLSTFIMQAVAYYNVSATSAGTLESYQNLSMIVFILGLFSLILKLGYRSSLMLIIGLMVIISILMPIINSYFMLKIYLIGLGLVFVAMKVVLYSTVPLSVKSETEQAMMLSLLEVFWALASVVGMWIMAHFMQTSNWLHFTWVFAMFGIITIVVWKFTPLDESAIRQEKQQGFKQQLKDIAHICNNRYLAAVILISFCASMVEMGLGAWLPGFYKQALSIPDFLSVKIASFALIATLLGRLVVVGLLKFVTWGRALFIYYSLGLFVLVYALFNTQVSHNSITMMSQVPFSAIMLSLFAFFLAPGTPLLNSSILARTAKDKHVLLMTVLTIIFALASSIGARLIGQLIDHFGVISGFKLATIIPLMILVILILPYEKFIHKGFIK
jgi:fucose permease